MKRSNFILTALAAIPGTALAGIHADIRLRTDKGFKVKAGEDRFNEHHAMKIVTSNVLDTKVSSRDTDGDLTILEQTGLTPKGGPPLHIHPFQDEIFYVLEGEYLFQVGSDRFPMKAGDTIFLPRNVPHAFLQVSDKSRTLVLYQPSGKMEEFFRTTTAYTAPPSQQEMVKLFEEHDMKVVGPPLKADTN